MTVPIISLTNPLLLDIESLLSFCHYKQYIRQLPYSEILLGHSDYFYRKCDMAASTRRSHPFHCKLVLVLDLEKRGE